MNSEGRECHLYANLKSGEGEWGDTGKKELNNKQHCLRPEKAFFPPYSRNSVGLLLQLQIDLIFLSFLLFFLRHSFIFSFRALDLQYQIWLLKEGCLGCLTSF